MKVAKKICLLGEFGVGKTSLIRRFVDNQFSDQYLSTVGVKISRKLVELDNSDAGDVQAVQLVIWDLEGRTKFQAIAKQYLNGASGAIVVGDVSRPSTLEGLGEHMRDFLTLNPSGGVIVALNKIDLIEATATQQLLQLASEISDPSPLAVFGTSAKTGERVTELFRDMSEFLVSHQIV